MACLIDLPDELLSAISECFVPLRQFVLEESTAFQVRMATNRLRRSTLVSLCRTSKRCKRVAQLHLYSGIIVNDPTTQACERLDHLLWTVIDNPKLAALVRYLEYRPQMIEKSVESNRPYEQAIHRVASTIFTTFDASVFRNASYGDKFAVAQLALLLYLVPKITHLSCTINAEYVWMETPLLLQALGLESLALPAHSELPPLPNLQYLCLLSTDPDQPTSSNASSSALIPWGYVLGATTKMPNLRHYIQSGVRYGLKTSNFSMLRTLCFHETLVPIENVCIAIENCVNLHTFIYSMASGHEESRSKPSFDASGIPAALISSKNTLQYLVLVHSHEQQLQWIQPLTSLRDLVALRVLTVSVRLIEPLRDHSCDISSYLPPSMEKINICLQANNSVDSFLSYLNVITEKKIECRVEKELDLSLMG